MVSFNEISGNRRESGTYIEIDNSLAVRGLQGMPHNSLIKAKSSTRNNSLE